MISHETLVQLVQAHGLTLLFPIAILEGPIVTVIASYMARLGLLNIYAVYVICVLADLVGDAVMYFIGRGGPNILPDRWRKRLWSNPERIALLTDHFHTKGGRTLLIGKITHSAGFLVLLAAGASRMPFWKFLWFNLLGTVPKTLFFTVIGYTLGAAYATIDNYIFRFSMVILLLLVVAAIIWFFRRKKQST